MAVFEFIEGWHNPLRRHSAIDYASPLEFERPHQAARDSKAANRPPKQGNTTRFGYLRTSSR